MPNLDKVTLYIDYISGLPYENAKLIDYNDIQIPKIEPRIRTSVLASGKGTNFTKLAIASIDSRIPLDIKLLVVNRNDSGAIDKAKELGIDYILTSHKDFPTRIDYDMELIRILKSKDIEAVIMAGWMRIITKEFVEAFSHRIINIHPSLLPKYPGINAVEQALDDHAVVSGCSVHYVNQGVDEGPLIIQAKVPIYNSDNKDTLLKRIQLKEHLILPIGASIAAINWSKK